MVTAIEPDRGHRLQKCETYVTSSNFLVSAARHLSLASEHFAAIYLLIHGAIKIALVGALLKHKLWAYPIAGVVFGVFIIYQIYRFTLTHGVGLIALSLFDLVVIWLICLEYRALKASATDIDHIF